MLPANSPHSKPIRAAGDGKAFPWDLWKHRAAARGHANVPGEMERAEIKEPEGWLVVV